jgi:hypothetical protein
LPTETHVIRHVDAGDVVATVQGDAKAEQGLTRVFSQGFAGRRHSDRALLLAPESQVRN